MGIRRGITKIALGLKKHSATIMSIGGAVCTIGGLIWACKATADSVDDIREAAEAVSQINESVESKAIDARVGRKETRNVIWNCAKKVGPRYIGPVTMFSSGLYFQFKSNQILTNSLTAMTSAFKIEKEKNKFMEEGIRQRYGEDALEAIKYGLYSDSAEIRTMHENGVETAQMQSFDNLVDPSKIGRFTFIFDKTSNQHCGDEFHCNTFLENAETVFTQRLRKNGVLWLWEVLKDLDIKPKSPEEAEFARNVCWTYDPSDRTKDCYVKLRYKKVYDGTHRDYVNGFDPVYIIDPNYDTGSADEWYKFLR